MIINNNENDNAPMKDERCVDYLLQIKESFEVGVGVGVDPYSALL